MSDKIIFNEVPVHGRDVEAPNKQSHL